MYHKGYGVKQDYKKVKKLWQQSAEQGLAQAQKNLKILCEKHSEICTQ